VSYRLEHITVAERVELGCLGVLCAGRYGLVTALAREHGVSRQFLYRLRGRAAAALERELAPRRPGRRPVERHLVVDRAAAERAVLVLHQVAGASVRGIAACLAALLRVERSVGWVQGVLTAAAARARALRPAPRGPLVALADELYAGRRPTLAVVDHASGLVAALEPAATADETAWGCVWLDLLGRGAAVAGVTADAAAGLAAGARAAGLGAVRADHWHALRELTRVAKRLEGRADRALAAADRAARSAAAAAYAAAHGHRPRAGRPLRAPSDPAGAAAAARAADEAIARADGVAAVRGWVRELLRPVEAADGRVRTAGEVAAELGAAAALLRELGGPATAAAGLLERRAAGLAGYLDDLAAALAGPRAALGEAAVGFLAWAWCHRRALGLADAAEARPADPAAARAVWAALDGAVRGSGMVENLNSILAFQRATRRGLPPTALALCAAYRNHHRFARGKRAGHTPLELAGLPSPDWLEALGSGPPPAAAPPNSPADPPETVTTLPCAA
jgi:hypothetical protein